MGYIEQSRGVNDGSEDVQQTGHDIQVFIVWGKLQVLLSWWVFFLHPGAEEGDAAHTHEDDEALQSG